MKQTALDYLQRDVPAYIDMIESVRRGAGRVLAADAQGVLLLDQLAEIYFWAADTPEAARRMAPLVDATVDPPLAMAAHGDAAADLAMDRFGLRVVMCCNQAMWPHAAPPTAPDVPLAFRALGAEWAEEVAALYSHDMGVEYIRGRLAAGAMLGAFDAGELAGFIGLHDEGSMGMLEVKPAFRRRGVGAQLLARLSARQLAAGRVPYAQFTLDNTASHRLHEALGFTISQERVYWLRR